MVLLSTNLIMIQLVYVIFRRREFTRFLVYHATAIIIAVIYVHLGVFGFLQELLKIVLHIFEMGDYFRQIKKNGFQFVEFQCV
jgi:uncharacterized membrane protein YdbT with pleckstrin-like domain